MERQDHLMLVTDAGAELHLGWDHDIPYTMDPLNGVPVDLQLAQGVNQVGQTVEDQSVAGVYRQITADCWGPHGDADADLLLRTLTYKTAGTLYFGDKWFCRFVVSKTPYTVQLHGFVRLEMMLFCPKPFWYSSTAASYTLGGFTAAFRFPVNYAQPHRFGIRQPNTFVNCRNSGALPVPFTATLRTDARWSTLHPQRHHRRAHPHPDHPDAGADHRNLPHNHRPTGRQADGAPSRREHLRPAGRGQRPCGAGPR